MNHLPSAGQLLRQFSQVQGRLSVVICIEISGDWRLNEKIECGSGGFNHNVNGQQCSSKWLATSFKARLLNLKVGALLSLSIPVSFWLHRLVVHKQLMDLDNRLALMRRMSVGGTVWCSISLHWEQHVFRWERMDADRDKLTKSALLNCRKAAARQSISLQVALSRPSLDLCGCRGFYQALWHSKTQKDYVSFNSFIMFSYWICHWVQTRHQPRCDYCCLSHLWAFFVFTSWIT